MVTIDDAADSIIIRLNEAGGGLNLLKLQKLMYYLQAWSLALRNEPLFDGRFQAWVHGPVNRELYDRFAATKSLYSAVGPADVRPGFNFCTLPEDDRKLIISVLDAYANFSGDQLEEMTHQEDPWRHARGGLPPAVRCETEIDETLMRETYAARVRS